ncbi:patatin-like phospholipase family protein [Brevibacillus ginsengisoli]|uniref:patatin-like phospholipase family protein n=1 Tax=Brevibacillus ginsengisoli TaxID=363854 RepID=UPI003CEB44C9
MRSDAVFEGGGVKGIALIGAISEMEQHGYVWEQLAGTSAGSIVAALICAGYTSGELYKIFLKLNYLSFLKRKGLSRLPVIGSVYQLLQHKGLYPGDEIEHFIGHLLREKGIEKFGDLRKDKLRIIASDITGGRMLILPDDLPSYDMDPLDFSIARAVRMSCSIPYFFQPASIRKGRHEHLIVDGALLSNFPVWLFDVPNKPEYPTFGFRLSDQSKINQPNEIHSLPSFTKALLATMLDAHDRIHVDQAHAVRTIFIPTNGIRTTQFDMKEDVKIQLYESGQSAAKKFLETWSFQKYVETFRAHPPPLRTI